MITGMAGCLPGHPYPPAGLTAPLPGCGVLRVRSAFLREPGIAQLPLEGRAMKKDKKTLPAPFAALTKDARFAGTYEVLVPVEGRVRPHRVPLQFATLETAQAWIHSPEGKEAIRDIVVNARN